MENVRNHYDNLQSQMFEELGAFFAFSNSQFEESKKENVVYVSLSGGLICPKENVKKLIDGIDTLHNEKVKADVEKNGAKRIIEREYFNYESQITMDTSNVLGALSTYIELFPELFTQEVLIDTFAACFQKACDNDWF